MANFETKSLGDVTLFSIQGSFDFHHLGDIRARLKDGILHSGSKKFLLDLTKTGAIDSTGLGTIVALFNTVQKQGGKFGVIATDVDVIEVFQTIGIARLFKVYGSEKEALDSI